MVLFMDRNERAPEIPRGVPESLWKPHKSKDLTFLHGSYTQLFFLNSKKIFFLEIDFFCKFSKNPEKVENFKENQY